MGPYLSQVQLNYLFGNPGAKLGHFPNIQTQKVRSLAARRQKPRMAVIGRIYSILIYAKIFFGIIQYSLILVLDIVIVITLIVKIVHIIVIGSFLN